MLCQRQENKQKCFQAGECIESYLFEATPVFDKYECLELCESSEKCSWSTYFPKLHLCELLYNCSGLDVEKCPDCLSSPIGCNPPTPQCWIQGQCEGNMISTLPASTQQDCLQLCKETNKCRWFTFIEKNDAGDFCILYHDCPIIDESCSACISGETRCEEDLSTTTSISTTAGDSSGKIRKKISFLVKSDFLLGLTWTETKVVANKQHF